MNPSMKKRLQMLEQTHRASKRKPIVALICRHTDSEEELNAIKKRHLAEHPEDADAGLYVFIRKFAACNIAYE